MWEWDSPQEISEMRVEERILEISLIFKEWDEKVGQIKEKHNKQKKKQS